MPAPFEFDFITPDYAAVWDWRLRLITQLRSDPGLLVAFKEWYRENPWDFITHWGNTVDPRNADIGLPTLIPFVLFDKQEDCGRWIVEKWRNRENGLIDKSRDMGMTWLAAALSCTLCLFNDGVSIGFGSRKEELVDKIGDPKTIFWKLREFMNGIPADFKGSYNPKVHAPHMRMLFQDNGSSITGEGGDGIGRGDRKSIYFVDEAAYIEHPETIDASLSNTTNCRIDISSVNGMANPFAQKRFSMHPSQVFTFHYSADPRKHADNLIYKIAGKPGLHNWHDWIKEKLNNDVVFAQEVEINYAASVEGVVIPQEWIRAAIGACAFLGIEATGGIDGALDVADQGVDLNAMAIKKGVELKTVRVWSGKGSDTFYTAERAFNMADEFDCNAWQYDGDGIGAYVKGDARVINDRRKDARLKEHILTMFRGSGGVISPEREAFKGRKNKDYFMNRKAQSWWSLRSRFNTVWRAVEAKKAGEQYEFSPADIISISPKCEDVDKLVMELSQPTYSMNTIGKMLIDKSPDNMRSPNRADAVMMVYSPRRSPGLFG